MVNDIPNAQDFYETGRELIGFAWEILAKLLINLEEAEYFGVDTKEVSDSYWTAAKRQLSTALSITQQGVEFILKGKIAEISPYILISDHPSKWPSLKSGSPIKFSQFRTLDAQDLIKVYDTFAITSLSKDFASKFNSLREKRNRIIHSVDKSLEIPVLEVIETILFMHKQLFPEETWGQIRYEYMLNSPDTELGSLDFVTNNVCKEIALVIDLLKPVQVKEYFGINKKQKRYFCPECYNSASHDDYDIEKLAVLLTTSNKSKMLYCPICNSNFQVQLRNCEQDTCPGNVLSMEDGICLTCGYY